MDNTDDIEAVQSAPGSTVVIARRDMQVDDRDIRRRYGAGLLALAAGLQTCTESTEWQFAQQTGMAPEVLDGPSQASKVSISLSHSGSLTVVVASSADACGIDIERNKPRRFDDIAAWLKWPEIVDDFPTGLDAEVFFRLWTLWEATVKLTRNKHSVLQAQVFRELAPGCMIDGVPGCVSNSWRCWRWVWDNRYQVTLAAKLHCSANIRIYQCDTGSVLSGIAQAKLLPVANLSGVN